MDLNIIAPIVEKIIKDTLRQRVYPFGVKRTGIGTKNASGTLINSIDVTATRNGDKDYLIIDMASYADEVENGRLKGTNVPLNDIIQWMSEKGINVRDEKGRYVKGHRNFKNKIKQGAKNSEIYNIAFAIQKSINKFGIRPSYFLEKSLENIQNNKQIVDLLAEEEMKDLQAIIENNFNKFKQSND